MTTFTATPAPAMSAAEVQEMLVNNANPNIIPINYEVELAPGGPDAYPDIAQYSHHLNPQSQDPSLFNDDRSSCDGDLFIESCDGAVFRVLEAVLAMSGGRFWNRTTMSGWPRTDEDLPSIRLDEDRQTVQAILQAIYPLPSPAITSLRTGLKCVEAAIKYGLSPSLFRIDFEAFSDTATVDNPFGLCCLAWCTGDWAILQHAFRFTHTRSLVELVHHAFRHPKGGEVLSAILATRAQKQKAVLAVVSMLPTNLLCESCRSGGRDASQALVRAVAALFDAPFPDMSRLFNDPESTWIPYLAGCPSNACGQSARTVHYGTQQYRNVQYALENVPQTIESWIIQERASQLRNEAGTAFSF